MSIELHDDCWNSIGVAGDQSCPKLALYVHCRNCDVYASAAQRNLQRPVDPGYRAQWAAQLGQARATRVALDCSGLAFRIGHEWLLLPTRMVASVAPLAPSHLLPHRSGGALTGIVNISGALLPSIALATLLGIDANDSGVVRARHVFARMVVIDWDGQHFALPVAELHGIVRYAQNGVSIPAATIGKGLQRYLTGVVSHAGMQIGVLDAALVGHQMTRLLR